MNLQSDGPAHSLHPPRAARYFGIDVPFMEYLGLEPLSLKGDRCTTKLPLRSQLTNSRGDMHGGTIMSVFDFTLSVAARSHDPLGYGVVTIDMATHFFEPARSDMTVVAQCRRRGRTIAFCDGEIVDDDGTVVAAARATFKLLPRAAS